MKKIAFILVIVLFCGAIAKGQDNDSVFNDYFISNNQCGGFEFREDTATWIDGFFFSSHYYLKKGYYRFEMTGLRLNNCYFLEERDETYCRLDRAQPIYTNTPLKIKGIAIGVDPKVDTIEGDTKLHLIVLENALYYGVGDNYYRIPDSLRYYYENYEKGKLRIMNSTLEEELISIDIDTSFILNKSPHYSYIEYSFDSLVDVEGLFYIVEDVSRISSTQINDVVFRRCPSDYPSLVRTAWDDDSLKSWVQWEDTSNFQGMILDQGHGISCYFYHDPEQHGTSRYAIPNDCQMFMFPIFAESVDDTNVSVYDVNVDRYSFVSPNPANDVVTVQSSFKIREIEIHNALGQVVLRKECSQNIETLDVSNLQSGTYIVKIKTQRGFATKKLIIR